MGARRANTTAGPAPGRRSRWAAAASVTLMVLSGALLVAALRAQPTQSAEPIRSEPRTQPTPRIEPTPRTEPERAAASAPHASGSAVRAAGPTRRWRAVLADLDRRRARAYAESSPRLLRRVYLPGSAVLRQDRALLRRYRQRGLRVVGLRMRVQDLRVHLRGDDHVVLLVRDRVAAGAVRGDGTRRRLAPDAVDTRLITLRRLPGKGWRIGAVRPA